MNKTDRPAGYALWPCDRQNAWVRANEPELARVLGLVPGTHEGRRSKPNSAQSRSRRAPPGRRPIWESCA
jgi:hypothetical protein